MCSHSEGTSFDCRGRDYSDIVANQGTVRIAGHFQREEGAMESTQSHTEFSILICEWIKERTEKKC
jgi:hypothetical protein